MPSCTSFHYPKITFRNNEKYLWNPILKKAYKNLPEERVRLQLVEYLLYTADFPKSRVSFESPVQLPRDKSNSRTDLICYSPDFKPLLLVECKAPEIKLSEKTALQIARYNQEVGAPFLLITNGKQDLWFEVSQDELHSLEEIPHAFQPVKKPETDFEYWCERGFAGKETNPEFRKWATLSCRELYGGADSHISFFAFDGTEPESGLANFYRIFSTGENTRLALSLTATPFSSTKLNAVLNHDGENIALLSASLDLIASGEPKNTNIQSVNGIEQVDLADAISFSFGRKLSDYASALSDLMS